MDMETLDILRMHNYLRKLHGSPPLRVAKSLQKIAAVRAKKYLSLANIEQTDKKFKYGENCSIIGGIIIINIFI